MDSALWALFFWAWALRPRELLCAQPEMPVCKWAFGLSEDS